MRPSFKEEHVHGEQSSLIALQSTTVKLKLTLDYHNMLNTLAAERFMDSGPVETGE